MFEYLNRGSADGDNIYEADFRSSHRVDAPLDTDVESDGQARSSKGMTNSPKPNVRKMKNLKRTAATL